MVTSKQQQNLRVQKWVAVLSVLILAIKFVAYYSTHSVAILTDALESIVNVTAGFIGLYSLYVAAKPRDTDHPYGHGKAEFLSAAIEGTLISVAGAIILYKAGENLIHPVQLQRLDTGIWLVAATALANFLIGYFCLRIGKKNNSIALVASGRHLQSDTYSTIGIILGLVLLYFTGLFWIDSIVAIVFGILIMITGYRILRKSIAGIMDEADSDLLGKMVEVLNTNRQVNWIDMHNLRVIKYGPILHLDCHLTVPWYYNVNEAHAEVDALDRLIRDNFPQSLEMFVHTDGCVPPNSCKVCPLLECPVRKHVFEGRLEWTFQNITTNVKHGMDGT